MLNVYADFCENVLAIPMIKGKKTDKEKFAGAHSTYTIEALMHDGKALQSGTSHNFGDGFAHAFGVQYTPNQVVIVPIMQKKEGVLEKANEVKEQLSKVSRVILDDSEKSPGWKFSEYEMRGIPVRVELGPRDIENNQAVLARRDTGEKITVSLDNIAEEVTKLLDTIQHDMLERARKHRDSHTYTAHNMEEFAKTVKETPGFVKAMWCGDEECENKIKEMTGATSRCMPFEQEHIDDKCVCCGKPAKTMVYWGKAY